ncbi:complex I NDUFA9 subunit family protein [Rivibacter subsaxonicus]|uniref:NADH dehydrogenase n=1 Tax=Rivibacter subsaxonicus TaxID=457575 RepID=A0A4Q7W053_9BURK|nr:complex I NDUFA9 subunit family protein [Rivibacter subsaxonicus]RZU02175.1 NADH dehydrogenase [Rivibacter subsaxonicus]
MRLLVLGGTGFVGSALAAQLVTRAGGGDTQIVVPSRRPPRHKALASLPGVQLVQADVHDPAALERLLAGCDAVVNLVAILHGSAAEFERTHVALPRTLAQACVQTGVRRVMHLSALGVGPQAPSNYLRSKAAGEAVLREAGLDLTLLRPSVIFGAGDRFLNLFASLQKSFPLMPLAGADAAFQPVWVEDVARAILACLDDPSTIGQTIECAGPKVYRLAELVRLAGGWAGKARPVMPLPDALARLEAGLLSLLPGEPLMSADNLASMKVPNVASGDLPGLERLGIRATALEAVGPGYLGALGSTELDAYRAAARRG